MTGDLLKALESEGWRRRFSTSSSRLQETVENYRSLGFEVKAVLLRELDPDGCTSCFDDENDDTVMIFTRKIDSPKENDLFNN